MGGFASAVGKICLIFDLKSNEKEKVKETNDFIREMNWFFKLELIRHLSEMGFFPTLFFFIDS